MRSEGIKHARRLCSGDTADASEKRPAAVTFRWKSPQSCDRRWKKGSDQCSAPSDRRPAVSHPGSELKSPHCHPDRTCRAICHPEPVRAKDLSLTAASHCAPRNLPPPLSAFRFSSLALGGHGLSRAEMLGPLGPHPTAVGRCGVEDEAAFFLLAMRQCKDALNVSTLIADR